MLTCIRKALDLVRRHRGEHLTTATIPAEDPATYAMIQRGDVIGVFQIESRAQMAMLPRLKPETFYDLVIEVAIVRPGPIQGGMTFPRVGRAESKPAFGSHRSFRKGAIGESGALLQRQRRLHPQDVPSRDDTEDLATWHLLAWPRSARP